MGAGRSTRHAVQVVAPAFGALAAVAQGDAGLRGQALAKGVDLRVVDVEHGHGVGREADFMVAHHQPEAAQRAGVEPGLDACQHIGRGAAQRARPVGKGLGHQRQAGLDQGRQRMVGRLDARRAALDGAAARGGAVQVEAEVDAVGAHHLQAGHGQAGFGFDGGQGVVQRFGAGAGDDEPQVQAVFALVVVVDAGVRRHQRGHGLQPLRRHGHGAQQGGPAHAGRPHAADAADGATLGQPHAGVDNFIFRSAQRFPHLGERPI